MIGAMPNVSVLVPMSGNCPHRALAWRYVQAWYATRHPDFEVVCGVLPDSAPWCKAKAVAQAAQDASGEVFVVADADCFAPALDGAVEALWSGYEWAMPHYTVNRLRKAATAQVYVGMDPAGFPRTRSWYAQLPYVGIPGGGIPVMRREVYESAPMDPGFIGWGQEDEAWAMALRTLHGRGWRPSRGSPLWHLWHPPQQRISRSTGSEKSRRMLATYKTARTRDEMNALMSGPRKFYEKTVSAKSAV